MSEYDLTKALRRFQPKTEQEERARGLLLAAWEAEGSRLLFRESEKAHITVSAFVMDSEMKRVLMVHHNQFRTYVWPGGHADGNPDLISVALQEVREETGIADLFLLSSEILNISVFSVSAHEKNGKKVPAHRHYSVCYGFLAPGGQVPRKKEDENSAADWLPAEQLSTYCDEPEMLPVYAGIAAEMRRLSGEKETLYNLLPDALLPWYRENARALPWRKDRDPYHVWLSEIMLQQTRVEAVKAYYKRFLAELPDISSLANAEEDRLLKLWEGLGYYNRARNLQKAARKIMSEHDGKMPSDYNEIADLPGIGAYTAGAISSICYELPVPAVDGNVLRVAARITEYFDSVDKPRVKDAVSARLAAVYPAGSCGNFTQALMELGATVCLPTGAPKCAVCPAAAFCLARRNGTADLLPVRDKKKARRVEEKTVFVLKCAGKIAIQKRADRGLLAGLWQLPNTENTLSAAEAMQAAAAWGAAPVNPEKRVCKQHIFTHVQWNMTCYYIQCRNCCDGFVWADPAELRGKYSLPTAFRMFL